jgi:hypothetical protein
MRPVRRLKMITAETAYGSQNRLRIGGHGLGQLLQAFPARRALSLVAEPYLGRPETLLTVSYFVRLPHGAVFVRPTVEDVLGFSGVHIDLPMTEKRGRRQGGGYAAFVGQAAVD